jgi:hypothetical protein
MSRPDRSDLEGNDQTLRLQADCVDAEGNADYACAMAHPVFLLDARSCARGTGFKAGELISEIADRIYRLGARYDSSKAMLRTWLNLLLNYSSRELRRRRGADELRGRLPFNPDAYVAADEVMHLLPRLEAAIRGITDPKLQLMARVWLAPSFGLEPLTLSEAAKIAGGNKEAFRRRYVEGLRRLILEAIR